MTAEGDGRRPVGLPPRLPWRTPNQTEGDPAALERIRQTMQSESYRLAEEDAEFLRAEAVRGPRLMLDYLKAEIGLSAHGIAHTVVVFGGTRIPEPAAARRRLEAASAELATDPQSKTLQKAARIAEKVFERSRYYATAQEFARLVARADAVGGGERIAIMTGGGPGLMEAANRGAYNGKAKSFGLNIALPHEQFPNPYLTPGLCFQFHYFSIRKLHFLHRARALVGFPGGFGTFDEVFETLVLLQTRKIDPLPVVLVGREFWSRAVDFDFLVEEGVIAPEDLDLFRFAETAEETFDHISGWYRAAGKPIFG